ncbi:MAG: hypothetical protein ACHQII_02180 [Bacteroidia bacterium]
MCRSISLVALFCLTCSKERWFSKITYEGTVYYSRATMKPAPGIWVCLLACDPGEITHQCNNFRVGQALTDANGHFKIHDNAARTDYYGVQLMPDSLNNPIRGDFNISGDQLQTSEWTTLYLGGH